MDKSSIMDVIKMNLTEALTDVITSKELVERSDKILYVDENQQSINDNLSLEERELLEDISAQWDLYLVNSYDIDTLQSLDFEKVKFPEAYLKEWYRQKNLADLILQQRLEGHENKKSYLLKDLIVYFDYEI
ncbi:TPA: hypothetical protein ACH1RX_002838 [Listeria monocytogenes]